MKLIRTLKIKLKNIKVIGIKQKVLTIIKWL